MRTVLLIEDALDYASFLCRLIGNEVVLMHAATLHEGVAALKHKKADVVLLDLTLPDSTREATLLEFKKANPTIPIIIVSGWDDPDFIENQILNNSYGYVVKGKTDTKEQVLHEIEEAIKYSGWNQVLKRAKDSMPK